MATIKIEPTSIDGLKSAIRFSWEQVSQAANLVGNAVNGISGMSFAAKYGLDSDLTGLKTRLNKQVQLLQTCGRTVEEAVNAFVEVDNSAGTSANAAWSDPGLRLYAAVGAVAAGLSLAAKTQLDKQSDLNDTFTDAQGGFNNIGTEQNPQYNFTKYKLYQDQGEWVGTEEDIFDTDEYKTPAETAYISKHGCLITSIAMLESLYQGTKIDPPHAITTLNMQFSNGKRTDLYGNPLYGYLDSANHYDYTPFSLKTLYDKLKEGPVIVRGEGDYGQHHMVVSGYTGDGSEPLKLSDFLVENPDSSTPDSTLDQYPWKKDESGNIILSNFTTIWFRIEEGG